MLSLQEASEWTGQSVRQIWEAIRFDPGAFRHLPSRLHEEIPAEPHSLSNRFLDAADLRRLQPPRCQKRLTLGIQKGGVGKTMIALNLATTWAAAGLKVLFIDLDPQASATNFLLPEEADYDQLLTSLELVLQPDLTLTQAVCPSRFDGLDLLAAKPAIRKTEGPLQEKGGRAFWEARLQDANYDLILFDVPPTLNALVLGAYVTSHEVVMPILPDIWSIESAELTIADIEEEATRRQCTLPQVHLLRNRFRSGRIASTEAQELLDTEYADRLLDLCIPETASIQNLVNEGNAAFFGGAAPVRRIFLTLSSTLWNSGESHA